MSDVQVVIVDAAERDITESYSWYRARSPDAADAFRSEVVKGIDRIVRAPMAWKADDAGNRRVILRRFPYSVVYEVTSASIIILAVAHHRKMPDYWLLKP